MKSRSPLIRINRLLFRYEKAAPLVLNIPHLTIHQGEFVTLVGASGCGKSTLLRLIAGLIRPDNAGPDQADGIHVDSHQQRQGMVFQSPTLVPWRTARANIRLPSELGRSPAGCSEQVIDTMLKLVGLDIVDSAKRAAELSGGMQMRVALARALVLSPGLLLMDEPFAALDDLLRMQLEAEVRKIHESRSLTTILVTHNISQAVFMSDRVLVLSGRPSGVQADIPVSFPTERNRKLRAESAFQNIVEQVTDVLYAASGVVAR